MSVAVENHILAKLSRRPMNSAELLDDGAVDHNELSTIMQKLVDDGRVEVKSGNEWGLKH